MSWDVALNARIVIREPSTTDIAASLENRVLDNVTQRRKPMLEFVGHDESGKARADGDDSDLARGVSILLVEMVRVMAMMAIGVSFRHGRIYVRDCCIRQLSCGERRRGHRCCK